LTDCIIVRIVVVGKSRSKTFEASGNLEGL
jgi:hypothetical protein